MPGPIYLDYNATTPVDPRVVERMLPYFTQHYGNPSSKGHAFGWAAEEAVKMAREEVAGVVGAAPESVIFTGGATESLNTAIRGVAEAYGRKGRHIITVRTEHSGVRATGEQLAQKGIEATFLEVQPDGLIRLEDLKDALREDTILVSVMWANNETGVVQPIEAISELVRSRDVLLLSDATQAFGKIPVDFGLVDLLTCTAHKLYGPKGIGALLVRRRNPRVRLVPQITGGSQEEGFRSGTLNVPGIVGFGAAAGLAVEEQPAEGERLQAARDRLEQALQKAYPAMRINGGGVPRLPHVANVTFPGVKASDLIKKLRMLAVSTGSACSTGSSRPSPVLKAMGLSDEDAASTLRISLGRFTTEDELDTAIGSLEAALAELAAHTV